MWRLILSLLCGLFFSMGALRSEAGPCHQPCISGLKGSRMSEGVWGNAGASSSAFIPAGAVGVMTGITGGIMTEIASGANEGLPVAGVEPERRKDVL